MAGRVARPHGLDGSFHVAEAAPTLLTVGATVFVGEDEAEIVGRKGTEAAPILRVSLASSREGVAALRGRAISVPKAAAPALDEDEYWADDLVGCEVAAGDRVLGSVIRMLGYPSCEVLELDGGGPLVPMVRDAIRRVDLAARRIEVDPEFLGV